MDIESKVRIVDRASHGESVAALCREFAIARKTFYQYRKQVLAYRQQNDLRVLEDQRRHERRHGVAMAVTYETYIIAVLRPRLGPKRIHELLATEVCPEFAASLPTVSAITKVMDEQGLAQYAQRRDRARIFRQAIDCISSQLSGDRNEPLRWQSATDEQMDVIRTIMAIASVGGPGTPQFAWLRNSYNAGDSNLHIKLLRFIWFSTLAADLMSGFQAIHAEYGPAPRSYVPPYPDFEAIFDPNYSPYQLSLSFEESPLPEDDEDSLNEWK